MRIKATTNPSEIKVGEDEIVIMADDKDWMKELAENIRKCSDKTIIREAEHDFFEDMVTRYGSRAAGVLLSQIWKMSQ